MPGLKIMYDGEPVFEGTIKDGAVELDFKSGFDVLVDEVDSDGAEFLFDVIRNFVDKCCVERDIDIKAYMDFLKHGSIMSLIWAMMRQKNSQSTTADETPPPADPS
jgi:hypothetical protein